QFMLRHATSHGLSLDFNYTFSKSIDIGSNAERISLFEGFGLGSQIINSWQPNALRAVSDFDTHHQITTNWIYELPVGRGKAFAGESGQRNELRGPGFFSVDLGLGKSWKITESQALTFRAEAFNISNSVRFDVATATINNLSLVNSTNFGKYISTLSSPRVMQFSLRYSF